jgi:hypothetical protein
VFCIHVARYPDGEIIGTILSVPVRTQLETLASPRSSGMHRAGLFGQGPLASTVFLSGRRRQTLRAVLAGGRQPHTSALTLRPVTTAAGGSTGQPVPEGSGSTYVPFRARQIDRQSEIRGGRSERPVLHRDR